jgi:hypothetical protein
VEDAVAGVGAGVNVVSHNILGNHLKLAIELLLGQRSMLLVTNATIEEKQKVSEHCG